MNGTEGLAASDWLYDTLTADATLQGLLGGPSGIAQRVGEGILPTNTALPLVTYTVGPEGNIVAAVGEIELLAQPLVLVKAIGQGQSYGPLYPIFQRVHALLVAQVNRPTPFGLISSVRRTSLVQYPERDNGTEYRHLGGLYAFQIE